MSKTKEIKDIAKDIVKVVNKATNDYDAREDDGTIWTENPLTIKPKQRR